MKFSARKDVLAPIDVVFERATEFERFERILRRQGVNVRRLGPAERAAALVAWKAQVDYRGKTRNIAADLTEMETPARFCMASHVNGVDTVLEVDFVDITPQKSRMIVGLELRPKTLAARLFVQSLKLGKANLDRKFEDRVARYASMLVPEKS